MMMQKFVNSSVFTLLLYLFFNESKEVENFFAFSTLDYIQFVHYSTFKLNFCNTSKYIHSKWIFIPLNFRGGLSKNIITFVVDSKIFSIRYLVENCNSSGEDI